MKRFFFFFAMLVSITASATVTVTPLSVDYATKKVIFKVTWTGTPYNDRVWVWVDLCPITGISPGTFAKAIINNPSAIAGSIAAVSGNNRGFYVTANPSTVTATLSNASGKFNWCAYGSDYPPNAVANGNGGYTLKGTPSFIITTSSGTTEKNDYTFSGGAITAFTDATGYPGVWCGLNNYPVGALGCCNGTTNCSGTCATNGTSTTNDGLCTGICNKAYVQLRDACGIVIDSQYATYDQPSCTAGCCTGCHTTCYDHRAGGVTFTRDYCIWYCKDNGFNEFAWFGATNPSGNRCFCGY